MSFPSGLTYSGYNGALTQVNGGGTGLSGSLVDGRPSSFNQIARKLKGIKNLPLRVILRALAAGGAGQAISNGTYVRRVGVTGINQGGIVVMETVTTNGASGNTAAGDITEMNDRVFNEAFVPGTYPADLSGNGGGGKGKF